MSEHGIGNLTLMEAMRYDLHYSRVEATCGCGQPIAGRYITETYDLDEVHQWFAAACRAHYKNSGGGDHIFNFAIYEAHTSESNGKAMSEREHESATAAALSAERLAEIRVMLDNINQRGAYSGAVSPSEVIYASVLMAEIDRLRAQRDAALEIVRAVADADNSDDGVCYQLCDYDLDDPDHADPYVHHRTPCVVEHARALLAEAADGEQE